MAPPRKKPRVISEEELNLRGDELRAEYEATLPPPGNARDEQKRMDADALEQAAAKANASGTMRAINPGKLRPIRELRSQSGPGAICSNERSDYAYAWVTAPQNSIPGFPSNALVDKVKMDGWEVVSGDDPEGIEWKDATGLRRRGDTIRMRIPKWRLEEIRAYTKEVAQRRRSGFGASLTSQGEAYARQGLGVIPHAGQLPDYVRARLGLDDMEALARKAAQQELEKMIRAGTVPGLKPGG